MNRFHVHVSVTDLDRSIGFYSTLFDQSPAVIKPDYAKWMLEDPRVNFAISTRGGEPRIDHLGIEVESAGDLRKIAERLTAAGRDVLEQKNEACCYARGDKGWTTDPAGIRWETFLTLGEHTEYGNDFAPRPAVTATTVETAAPCCAPTCCGGDKQTA